nr:MAG TPA: minor capsid protein [Caudoviricetes sp.]
MIHINKWEKEVQQSLLDSEEAAIKELEKQYARALKDITDKVKSFQADIDLLDQALSQDGLDDATKALLQSQKRSKVYQQNYQKALKGQVSGVLDKLHGDNYATIDKYLKSCYETGYIGTMYDIAKQGVPIIAPIDQSAAVKAVLTDSKIVEGYYSHLGVNYDKLKKTITQEISRGIASGLPYSDIARNINNVSGSGLSNAKRIARTEGHRIQQTSSRDAQYVAKKKGCDVVKQWDSTLDGRTRDSHARVDGETRELDEEFSNGLMFPGDPSGSAAEVINCRCTSNTRARWALDDGELQTLKERAEYFGLDKTANFEDYKQKYLTVAEAPIVQNTDFTPAKTIEEAEEYAKRFVDTHYQSKYSGNISYKGMSLENANKVNQVLNEVYSNYDVSMLNNLKPMNFRETKWKTAVEDGIAAAYQWGNGGTLFMNQKIFASEKVTSAFTKKANDLLHTVLNGIDTLLGKSGLREKQRIYLEALKKTGVQCFAQTTGIDFAEATFVHESGHLLDDKIFRKLFKEKGFDISASMEKYAGNISGYAVSTNAEYIAESFTAFWYGKTDILDPDLVKIFQGARTVTKSSIVNPATDDIISSVKAFAKGSKDFPTVFLPKQEYAHVMSEIATNITKEQSQKSVFEKAIGNYIYTVENNGFGNYRIIDKTFIDAGDLDEIW